MIKSKPRKKVSKRSTKKTQFRKNPDIINQRIELSEKIASHKNKINQLLDEVKLERKTVEYLSKYEKLLALIRHELDVFDLREFDF